MAGYLLSSIAPVLVRKSQHHHHLLVAEVFDLLLWGNYLTGVGLSLAYSLDSTLQQSHSVVRYSRATVVRQTPVRHTPGAKPPTPKSCGTGTVVLFPERYTRYKRPGTVEVPAEKKIYAGTSCQVDGDTWLSGYAPGLVLCTTAVRQSFVLLLLGSPFVLLLGGSRRQ